MKPISLLVVSLVVVTLSWGVARSAAPEPSAAKSAQPGTCAQWQVRMLKITALKQPAGGDGWTFIVPEGWEPIGTAITESTSTRVLLRKCAP